MDVRGTKRSRCMHRMRVLLHPHPTVTILGLVLLTWCIFRVPVAHAQVAATEGMVVYGETGKSTPSYKQWNGSTFSAEQNALDTATGINWVLLQGIPNIRNEKIMGVMAGGSNTLYIQRWNGTSWSNEWTTTLASANKRSFAIAYEQFSGVALVIYGDSTTQLKYRKWDGTTWTGELSAGTALDGTPQFVMAMGRPSFVNTRKNDITTMVTTAAGSLYAMRWNNGAWGDQVKMDTNPAQVDSDVVGITYERTRGEILLAWGTIAKEIRYRKFTSAWQAETVAYSGLPDVPKWLDIAPDRTADTNRAAIIWNDAGQNIRFGVWNGSGWEAQPAAVATDQIDRRNISVAWEKHTGKAMFVFAKKSPDGKALSWRTWTPSAGFSAVTQEAGELNQKIRWLKLRYDAKSNNLQLLALDIDAALSSRRWDGSAWDAGFTTQESSLSSAGTEPFDFFWDDVASGLKQNYHRFYVDNDALLPTDPWPVGSTNLGENTAITFADLPPASGENVRIRISTQISILKFVTNEERFKLQFAQRATTCSAIATASWSDIGAIGSTAIWRGVNGTPADGASLSGNPPTSGHLLVSVSDRAGTYEESNPSALNPFEVAIGEDVEHDWFLQDNGATAKTTYCFRTVLESGLEFDQYAFYPQVTTSGYRARSRNWRFYDDITVETPVVPLAAENVAPTGFNVQTANTMKLRVTIAETAGVAGTDVKFKLQASPYADFSQSVQDLLAIGGTCTGNAQWCYVDGVDADNAAITTRVLTDSTSNGTHNESGTSASTLDPAASSVMEFEFTLGPAALLRTSATYSFRVYNVTEGIPVPADTGATAPNIATEGPALSFTVSGLASGTITEGITTDAPTTATAMPLGTLPVNALTEVAQRLTITTNAMEGYRILFGSPTPPLQTAEAIAIPGIGGTNASPIPWSFQVNTQSGITGAVGYHPGDDTLSDSSTRFAANDTWAPVESTNAAKEIAYASGPVTAETIDVILRTEISAIQRAGSYTLSDLQYIVVPVY